MDMLEEGGAPVMPAGNDEHTEAPENQQNLVTRITKTIRADKKHHEKAYKQMVRDMFVARNGRTPEWPDDKYTANIIGRHIKQKTASLYAKNPKAVARRRETLDFTIWDENPQTLQTSMQTVMTMGSQIAASQAPQAVEMNGIAQMVAPPPIDPILQQAFEGAQAIVQDAQQGLTRRREMTKIGKTLEVLFTQALREQKPVDFKTGCKQMVRRACTTGVGYVEIGFQREMGPRPAIVEKLADARARLDHLRRLAEEVDEGEILQDDAEMAELEYSVTQLENEPEIVLREGLIFDWPQSTKVIPDKLCRQLIGFIGARHLTVEYVFTSDEVREMFGVDLEGHYTSYRADGKSDESSDTNTVPDDTDEGEVKTGSGDKQSAGLVCVWKHYDKPSGLVYYVADGHKEFLREPAAPDVFVEDFWPVYALTFNAVESEDALFPPSDVALLTHMQMEHNRARQGQRDHRLAARPRWVAAKGALDNDDTAMLMNLREFQIGFANLAPGTSINDVLEAVEIPGVDPNLYETNQFLADSQIVAGAQQAQLGAVSASTATESAIAANSSASSDGSSVDDLDAFLTVVARGAGQILLREMSEEQVKTIAGPGAVWPHMSLSDLSSELFLEVEAGSSGKPNQAVEIDNFVKLAPIIQQIPGISPTWYAREALRRMDDRFDLTEALSEGVPSMVAMNAMQQPTTGDVQTDPTAQGAEGGNNGPPPAPGTGGSGPAFGTNQI